MAASVLIQLDRHDTVAAARVTILDAQTHEVLRRCRKVNLRGTWAVRQYTQDTTKLCGATAVLYPIGSGSTYEVLE